MKKSIEWLLSLEELLDEELAIEETAVPSSSNWTHNVNRGGLYFVSDDAFDVFIAIENVIRRYYCRSKAREISCGKKEEIMEEVTRDEEVKMNWSIVALYMNVEIGKELLKMIVEEWIKIRGFSFAGAWLELYKQRSKKSLQHSKGLHKVLITDKSSSMHTYIIF